MPWMDSSVYPPRHYSVDTLSPSDIGIVRTHPSSYYEQYENQYGQQYDTAPQYSNPQYGLVYPQQTYYNAPEKRFMVSRKRSQVTLRKDPENNCELSKDFVDTFMIECEIELAF